MLEDGTTPAQQHTASQQHTKHSTMKLAAATLLALSTNAAAHSNLIYPKSRNAIDSNDPRWLGGKGSPDIWQPQLGAFHGQACACRNGSSVCDIGQTCLWMSVGCSLGCAACDGGTAGGTNPNTKDRCGTDTKKGLKPWTHNSPYARTMNRNCTVENGCVGTARDGGKWNPWRAPGAAPSWDPCGRAGGGPVVTGGKGDYTKTKYAQLGMLGSKLPKQPSGAVWKAGSVVETLWSIRANHGGGYQYRLCPLGSALTEECFKKTPMEFAGNSSMMMSNGKMLPLESRFTTEGTTPAGSTWQMNPIPMVHDYFNGPDYKHGPNKGGFPFPPPCDDPYAAQAKAGKLGLSQGLCTGEWITNITIYDKLRVPKVPAGKYVLGFRYDCESSAQVWQQCADLTITA